MIEDNDKKVAMQFEERLIGLYTKVYSKKGILTLELREFLEWINGEDRPWLPYKFSEMGPNVIRVGGGIYSSLIDDISERIDKSGAYYDMSSNTSQMVFRLANELALENWEICDNIYKY